LTIIGELIAKGAIDPKVVKAARQITSDCSARDDLCELEAIFRAVKEGDPRIPGLEKGLRYVSDPRSVDWYQGAKKILEECEDGACAGDCDEHNILVGALAASIGFKVGARAYGKAGSRNYTHVYCVAAVPKNGPWPKSYGGHGLDTTVASASVGWEPPKGRVMTYWPPE
jgi:hypothetical protein